jgi:hypothetical protein
MLRMTCIITDWENIHAYSRKTSENFHTLFFARSRKMSTYNLYVEIILHGEILFPHANVCGIFIFTVQDYFHIQIVCGHFPAPWVFISEAIFFFGNKNSPCRKISTYHFYVEIILTREFSFRYNYDNKFFTNTDSGIFPQNKKKSYC